ncbi:MAG: YihY/virulence factor BrkB family protein [Candidatus Binatia bacterium]
MTVERVCSSVIRRAYRGIADHEVTTAAASVSFFVLLAVFPGLAAVTSLVGMFADPEKVDGLLSTLSGVIPEGSAQFLSRQIGRLARTGGADGNRRALAVAPILGFAVLLWSANRGTKALFHALNLIQGQEERRGFLKSTLVTLTFTIGGIVFLALTVAVVVVLPLVLEVAMPGDSRARWLGVLRWPVLLVVISGVLAVIYRFGPSREHVRWSPIAFGSGLGALLWIGGSLLFSWYVSTFGGLTEVYGSLSAVIGFMVWIWLSVIAVLFGAELEVAAARRSERAHESLESATPISPA